MPTKASPTVYQTVNVVSVVAVLIMNTLVNVLPLNGVTTAQVSDSYPNLFTPPGYVFSIWGRYLRFGNCLHDLSGQAEPTQRRLPE
jgi:hypothetical protein